ncbi:MAG: hypothetical protein AABX04_06700 [Nanoarchaeota archaeon]
MTEIYLNLNNFSDCAGDPIYSTDKYICYFTPTPTMKIELCLELCK